MLVLTQLAPDKHPNYRDELIVTQKREIELLQMQVVDLQSRLLEGQI